MNIYDGTFTDCTPYDYYNVVTSTNAAYVLNATTGMCFLDFGFLPEISANLTRWFRFENQTDFDTNFAKVVRFINTPKGNKSYGLFYNHVTCLSDADVITLSDTLNSSIILAVANICGNMVIASLEIRMVTMNAGNNDVGKLKISPNMTMSGWAFIGASSETGTPVRLYINTAGQITAVMTSARTSVGTLRFSLIYPRKYNLYS